MDEQNKKWSPNPSKHADDWRKMWFTIIDSRRFSIRQTHGDEAAKRYRPLTAEENFFKSWGKLPHHVNEDDTELPAREAMQIAEMVDKHHDRYWVQMTQEYREQVQKFWKRLCDQLAEVQSTPAYQLSQDDRDELMKYSQAIVDKMRNLHNNGKETNESGQQGIEATARQATEQTQEGKDNTVQE